MKVAVFLLCFLPLVLCAPSDIDKRWLVDSKCFYKSYLCKKQKTIKQTKINKNKQISKQKKKIINNTSHTYTKKPSTKNQNQTNNIKEHRFHSLKGLYVFILTIKLIIMSAVISKNLFGKKIKIPNIHQVLLDI